MTKTKNIAEELRCRILSGKYPSGKLPGERELAAELSVGRNTVRSALKILEDEKILERKRKTGTVLKADTAVPGCKTAGLIMRSTGHVFDDLYHTVLSAFVENGYAVQSIPTDSFMGDVTAKPLKVNSVKSAIQKLLYSSPDVIVLDGYCNTRLPFRKELWQRNTILFNFLDSADDAGKNISETSMPQKRPNGVWFDFENIGYIAGKYLLDKGCRKPLFVPQFIPVFSRMNREYYPHHREQKIAKGFAKALNEKNIDPACCIVDCWAATLKQYNQILESVFQNRKNLPDGFFSSSDSITVKFIKEYLGNFGTLPKDIICLGVGNTPWSSNNSLYPFSSIDFNLSSLTEEIIRMAECPANKRCDVYIKPFLVER